MIRVKYKNGEEDLVTPKFLDILLYLNEVEKFQRAGTWVSVSHPPERRRPVGSYSGKERRRHSRAILHPFALENQPRQDNSNR